MQTEPIPNDHRSIHDIVRDQLLQDAPATPWRQRVLDELEVRKKRGLETYGTILQPGNGRDAVQDAFEEQLDNTVYLQQVMREAEARDDQEELFRAKMLYRSASALCIRIAHFMYWREHRV